MGDKLLGASAWEQDLFDAFGEHVEAERGMLEEYEALAEETSSVGFGYLAKLILDDERRHHRLFGDLADSVQALTEARTAEAPVPPIPVTGLDPAERERILDVTSRFLEHERHDFKELSKLAKELRPVRETTLWHLLIQLVRADTEKHIKILEFIQDRVKHPAISP